MTANEWLAAIEASFPLDRRHYSSETKRLLPVFNKIEGARAEGVSPMSIHERLRSAGLVMTFGSFQNALARIRAARRAAGLSLAPTGVGEREAEAKRSKPADDPAPPGVGEKAEKVEDDVQSFFDKIDNSVYNPDYKRGEK